jgi:hypothetical protein
VAPKATDETAEIDVDTVIFAIGDVHDATLGIPTGATGYVTRHSPDPKQTSYEVFDPQKGQILDGNYVVGWASRASEGLVGIARHDVQVRDSPIQVPFRTGFYYATWRFGIKQRSSEQPSPVSGL